MACAYTSGVSSLWGDYPILSQYTPKDSKIQRSKDSNIWTFKQTYRPWWGSRCGSSKSGPLVSNSNHTDSKSQQILDSYNFQNHTECQQIHNHTNVRTIQISAPHMILFISSIGYIHVRKKMMSTNRSYAKDDPYTDRSSIINASLVDTDTKAQRESIGRT